MHVFIEIPSGSQPISNLLLGENFRKFLEKIYNATCHPANKSLQVICSQLERQNLLLHGLYCWRQVCLAYKTLTNCDLPQDAVKSTDSPTYTFEDFCCLVSEYRYQSQVSGTYYYHYFIIIIIIKRIWLDGIKSHTARLILILPHMCTLWLEKNCAKLFLSEFRQISTNC